MDITTALSAGIRELTTSLDLDEEALPNALTSLTRDLKRAVKSFSGLQLTFTANGQPITLTHLEAAGRRADLVTSLHVPLATIVTAEHGSEMIFFASQAGALVDLAADFAFALGLEAQIISLDQHLPTVPITSGIVGSEQQSTINRAIGMLIDQGLGPDQAHQTLAARAVETSTDTHYQAQQVLELARQARIRD